MAYHFTKPWFASSELKHSMHYYVDPNTINKILEIGAYEGASTCYFSDIMLNNENSRLTCVDPFDINDSTTNVDYTTKNVFLNNIKLSKNFDKITFKNMYSSDFYKENTLTYNFIYIDGSHLVNDIKIDFLNCLKLIENGGIIWMDDYLGGAVGDTTIRDCIDQLYEQHKDQLMIIHKAYQIAFRKI